MVYQADDVSHPEKSYDQLHYFKILSTFCMTFVLAISWPTPCGGGLRKSTFYDYIIHLITDLKWNINCYW